MYLEGKQYLNIQEQVEKNRRDICGLRFGLNVVAQYAELPTTALDHVGDACIVDNGTDPAHYWIYLGQDADDHPRYYDAGTLAGPTGPAGPTGSQGVQGERGSRWISSHNEPSGVIGFTEGDQWLNTTTGIVYQFNGAHWEARTSISGPQGAIGVEGPAGPIGPQGVQGERGLRGPIGVSGTYLMARKFLTVAPLAGNSFNIAIDELSRAPQRTEVGLFATVHATVSYLLIAQCTSVSAGSASFEVIDVSPAVSTVNATSVAYNALNELVLVDGGGTEIPGGTALKPSPLNLISKFYDFNTHSPTTAYSDEYIAWEPLLPGAARWQYVFKQGGMNTRVQMDHDMSRILSIAPNLSSVNIQIGSWALGSPGVVAGTFIVKFYRLPSSSYTCKIDFGNFSTPQRPPYLEILHAPQDGSGVTITYSGINMINENHFAHITIKPTSEVQARPIMIIQCRDGVATINVCLEHSI